MTDFWKICPWDTVTISSVQIEGTATWLKFQGWIRSRAFSAHVLGSTLGSEMDVYFEDSTASISGLNLERDLEVLFLDPWGDDIIWPLVSLAAQFVVDAKATTMLEIDAMITAALDAGRPKRQIARQYGISESTVSSRARKWRDALTQA